MEGWRMEDGNYKDECRVTQARQEAVAEAAEESQKLGHTRNGASKTHLLWPVSCPLVFGVVCVVGWLCLVGWLCVWLDGCVCGCMVVRVVG